MVALLAHYLLYHYISRSLSRCFTSYLPIKIAKAKPHLVANYKAMIGTG